MSQTLEVAAEIAAIRTFVSPFANHHRLGRISLALYHPLLMIRVLVTANHLSLAGLLEKGLRLQGWTTSIATNYSAVIEAIGQTPNLVLVDADFFQADTASLVSIIQQQQLSLILLAGDYKVGGYDLRKIAAPEDIFIKPFSTRYLMTVLKQKLALSGCSLTR
ncbi:hypothetical protein ACQ4M4_22995 [Leptolyngbya sp. AN02str]|uniref:hypothetical protein n=1 Tax=Leptolyngbya sp. AN02str TaxID=3423363 RepID=UPI003D3212CB